MKKRVPSFFLICLSLFIFSGCSATFDLDINFPIGSHKGVVVNETNYTLNVLVEDLNNQHAVSSFNISPGQKINLALQEKRYRFSSVFAYSGERGQSTTLHINAIKGDAYYDSTPYDWYVIFSRRVETHP